MENKEETKEVRVNTVPINLLREKMKEEKDKIER